MLDDVQHVEAVAIINRLAEELPYPSGEALAAADQWLKENHPEPAVYMAALLGDSAAMTDHLYFGVAGYCPMGCGRTLFRGEGGHITCSWVKCPRPSAVDELLQDSETEHVVTIRRDGFTVQHPLRERLDGALHDCELHQELQALGGPPEKPGRYRAFPHEPDADSEAYRGSDSLARWNLLRLDGSDD